MNPGRGNPHTLDGRTQSLAHWAREYNIPLTTVHYRLKRGMDLRTALTADSEGDGYRALGPYGILDAWRHWISAPVTVELSTDLSTASPTVK